MNTTHSTICKFDSNSAGSYREVYGELKKLMVDVKGQNVEATVEGGPV
jgi:hypothetical protein